MKIAAIHVGHSHLAAMTPCLYNRPYQDTGKPNKILHFVFDTKRDNVYAADDTKFNYSILNDGKLIINPRLMEYIDQRVDRDAKRVYFCQFGGNSHNSYMLLQSPNKFDFTLPKFEHLELDTKADVIPFNAVKEVICRNTMIYLNDLRGIKNSVNDDVYHIMSPPPIFSGEKILEVLNADGYFANFENKIINSYSIRLKSWLLHSMIFREAAEECGVKLLETEKVIGKTDNKMPLDCIGYDPTHGNLMYGGKVFNAVENILNGDFAGWGWLQEGF